MTRRSRTTTIAAGPMSRLCPDDWDLERFVAAHAGINRSRRQVCLVLLPPGVLIAWWWSTPAVWIAVGLCLVLAVVNDLIARYRSVVIAGILIAGSFELALSAVVTATGGIHSPLLAWLILPVMMLAARYRRVVLLVAMSSGALAGAVACLLADLLGTAKAYPSPLLGLTTTALGVATGLIAMNLQSADIASRQDATTDELTGALNRKALTPLFDRMSKEADARESHLSMLLCDLDHFKSINDRYGHAVGDDVLCHAATVIRQAIRAEDRMFRIGGEEFLILLPHADAPLAAGIGERIRATLAASPADGIPVTVSIGSVTSPGRLRTEERELQELADQALYQAKSSGRNRVVAATPPWTADATAASHPARL
ncbi:GGDEF domain-containing protein [Actinoplanes subglobosus]|uniref:GGDEF domain-containing protein n=1 Tax=Actinoplanes subglobosus TaxID=1547892 RepID=A0ABV8IRB7_9ACTN